MPQTPSNVIELGTQAAEFILPDADGNLHRLSDFDGTSALLVAFISNRCPFVLLLREQLAAFGREYLPKGLQIVAINSNDAEAHPEETLSRIGDEVRLVGYPFPYLKDASQSVAQAYGAACTPDFFLFDAKRQLAYHGQFDDARPKNGKEVTGADLRAAADALLDGGVPRAEQTQSIGCNIKWTPGNEPSAFENSGSKAA